MAGSELYVRGVRLKRDAEGVDDKRYPFFLPFVRQLDKLELKSPVCFFVGENGAGKSTLIEAIAISLGFNPEGGSRNFNFSTKNTHSELHAHITVIKGSKRAKDGYFLRSESFYNVASEIENLEDIDSGLLAAYGGKSLHTRSHGESFMDLVCNRFFGNGLYLLDEPESALSPTRLMMLLKRMNELSASSQFLIATHSPILMAYPGAQIFVLSETGIEETPYHETEHYFITKQFLQNPERMLRYLFEEGS